MSLTNLHVLYSAAPCFPQDFLWSSNGYPEPCGCDKNTDKDDEKDKRCNLCKCLSMKSNDTPKAWRNNHFCYKSGGEKDPNFQLIRNGKSFRIIFH